ncbi:MAG: CPBP family intramembrane glutamic endopeptidase, partial [Bacillota bacterium]
SFKHKPFFWVFAIATPILLGGIFQLTYLIFKDHPIESSTPFYLFFIVLINSIIFGGLEEIGWRGFVQEKLMKNNNLILVSLAIGIIWGLWHIPLFFIEEVSHYNFSFLPFLFGAIMFSTYLTWLYSVTKSLLLVVLFHASINASATIGLSLIFENTFLAYFIIIILAIIGIALLYFTSEKNTNFNSVD